MRCSKAREFISDALDSRLDERRGIELSGHLADCSDCRRHQSILEEAGPLLRENLLEPADNFEWKVQLKIQQALREQAAAPEPVGGWAFWRPAMASASGVAAVVLLVGGFILSRPGPQPAGLDLARSSVGAAQLAEATPSRMVPEALAEVGAEPDLSGAVRVSPLRVNAGSDGFGIRTVAGEQFMNRSPFPDPNPVEGSGHWREERAGETVEVRKVQLDDGRTYYMMLHRRSDHAAGLNLERHRSTLRVIHPVSGAEVTRRKPGS